MNNIRMKITTINIGDAQIEFHNALSGRETIKLNGEIVSSKFSFSGMEHIFKAIEGGEEVTYKLTTGTGLSGVMFSLYRNEIAIIESPKTKGWIRFALVALILLFLGTQVGELFAEIFNK